jgi:uncharacterized protein YyaL (SSP411 family)
MNRLAGEASSYLRSAAHQPVHWQPFGEAAFAQAKREDKPILLDVGAVWCHWCHVMDRESYEDAAIAERLNRAFVAVKVDRDERPDVDARYQKAVQALTGQGGWPLTAFLFPDGRVFYGGTYFPPRDAHGRPSFGRVLDAIAEAWRERRDELVQNADAIGAFLGRDAGAPREPAPEETWPALLDHAAMHIRGDFDVAHGGFGHAPKFPHPAAHDFLLARGDAASRDVAMATLQAMRAGGVYDQLAGGFHRYSVDAEWIVPHFEKMLYDNAGLLRNYTRAGLLDTAREILFFLRDVLAQPEGGFGGSQDADINLQDDGDFFTWTLDELRDAVGDPALAKLMTARYGVREQGDMHHDPKRCVLRLAAEPEALAAAFGRPVEADLAKGKGLMVAARETRQAPFVDPTRYASWNGMAVGAILEYAGVSGDEKAEAFALRTLDLFLARAYAPERGFARTLDARAWGILDDDAQMMDALLEAHFATGQERYLRAAREVADLLLSRFRHPLGGFADRAADLAPQAVAAPVAQAERPLQDAPTASANGVALRALLRLSDASGQPRYAQAARADLAKLAPDAPRLGLFGGALLLALDDAVNPPPRIVVASGDSAPWRALARRHAKPGATFAGPDDPGLPEEARAFRGEGAMVCLGTRCLAPARTPAELVARLAEARKPQIPP